MGDAGDSELIARFKRGDRTAFDALVLRYLDRVAGVARRFLGDGHEALDVAQDVFVAAFQALRSWREEGQLFSWLYRTTLNLCAKRLRARARVSLVSSQVSAPAPAPPDPAGRADLAQAIDEALEVLSERQREVFLRCHEEGLPLSQIARRLGISLGATKSHLHRALVTLRDNLKLRKLL
jgi:RNA polymerase sigma-70 factor (ECF subfamily)